MSNTVKNKWKKLKKRGIACLLTAVMVITLLISNRWGVALALDEGTQAVEDQIIQLPPGQIAPLETTETPSTGEEGATPGTEGNDTGSSGDYVNMSDIPREGEKEPSAEAPPEGGGQDAGVSAVSGQPENGQDGSGNNVSGQPGEEMTDAVKAFLAAMDRLRELAASGAPAEEMLAAEERARGLYEKLTKEEKAIQWVAEGKKLLDGVMPLDNEDTVTVSDGGELKAAAENSGVSTIILGGDIVLGDQQAHGYGILTITRTLTLNLNGHELRQGGEADVIKVNRGVTFTLTDSSSGGGVITGGQSSHVGGNYQEGGFYGGAVCCYGDFIMNGGTISGNGTRGTGYGGGVYCEGNFTMNGGTIKGNQAVYGGGVFCRGNFTMNGGTIEDNQARYGGGVYCLGEFTMAGETINRNTAELYGGGVFCERNVTMTNGTISGNNAGGTYYGRTYDGEGGGVYCNGNFTISGGTVNSNNITNNSDTLGADVTRGGTFNNIDNGGTVSSQKAGVPRWERPASVQQPAPPVHGHRYTQTKPPSCTENGEERCDCGQTRAIPALGGHSYGAGAVTVEPKCETAGVRTFTCSRCGDAKTEAIPALGGHSYNNGTITTAAKCETAGVRTFTCGRCGNAKTEAVPALGHNYDDGKITTAATCENTGVRTFTCGRCGGTKTGMVLALGHNYIIGTITTDATCETAGVRRFTCERCDSSRMEPIPALGGHSYGKGMITTAATCQIAGERTFTCSRCSSTKTEKIPATGHRWDIGTVTKKPTRTKEGVRRYTCGNDASHKKTVFIAKLEEDGSTADTASEIQYEYPTFQNITPDPNNPESPEVIVVINDNSAPMTYRKVQGSDDSNEMIYIEDSSIPLAAPGTEKTENWGVLVLIMTLMSVSVGIVVIFRKCSGAV